mgnify:CR=1 FL=1
MATSKIGGINYFIWQYNGTNYQLVGCATGFTVNRSVTVISTACQVNGSSIGKEAGAQNNTASIEGLRFDWTSGEETAQWTYNDFVTNMEAKTKTRFRIGASSVTAGTKLEDFTAVISSMTETVGQDAGTTYSVSLEIDGAITQVTIP